MKRGRRRSLSGGVGISLALLLMATPSASGAITVVSSHGSNLVAQVVWSESYDPTTDVGRYGGIAGDIEDSGTIVSVWDVENRATACLDGTPGIFSTWKDGDGPGAVKIAPNLGTAHVDGVLTITTSTYDSCTNTSTWVSDEAGVSLQLDLAATTRPSTVPWKYHDLVPAQYNLHEVTRSSSREATGTASLRGGRFDFDAGLISRNSWNDHETTH